VALHTNITSRVVYGHLGRTGDYPTQGVRPPGHVLPTRPAYFGLRPEPR
jgi:hypothetical protein